MKYYFNYCLIAYPSTFLYKLYDTHYIKIKRNNQQITRLLLGEKILTIGCSTILSPIVFPFIIGKIINKINKITTDDYEKPTNLLLYHIINYLVFRNYY